MSLLQELRDDLGRTGEYLAEGWRTLTRIARSALTYFAPADVEDAEAGQAVPLRRDDTIRWGLLAADVADTGNELVLNMEVPGLTQADVDVQIEGRRLSVRGTRSFSREESVDEWHYRERAFGSFRRAFALPCDVDAARCSAALENGVLTIRLPKTELVRQQRIAIRT